MKVKALSLGFMFNRRIREGEEFELKDEKLFSKKWMVKVEAHNPEKMVEEIEATKVKKKIRKINKDVL